MQPGREGLHPHAPIGWPIMSDAALKLVAACTHPQVKGATRRFYKAVADQVPAGQTTTPPLTLPELALAAEQTARTAQTARNLLTGLQLIAVHDGGRGNKARYEVCHLDGAPPPRSVPLPLRADLREAPRTIKERSTSEIPYDQTAINVGSYVRSKHRKFFLRWWAELRNVGNYFLRLPDRTIKQRSTSDPTFAAQLPLGVAGTRARDVHTFKDVHTPAAPANDVGPAPPPTPVPARPCRYAGTVHAWCAGRVHVPTPLHKEFLAKLGRLPGETAAAAEARLVRFYVTTCAGLPAALPIGVNDFAFWRPLFAAWVAPATARSSSATKPPVPRRRPDIPMVNYCSHQPTCTDGAACVDLMMADFHAKKQRQADVG